MPQSGRSHDALMSALGEPYAGPLLALWQDELDALPLLQVFGQDPDDLDAPIVHGVGFVALRENDGLSADSGCIREFLLAHADQPARCTKRLLRRPYLRGR